MKALFVIWEADPIEYFEQMERLSDRVESIGGTASVTRQFSTKRKLPYYEYRFEAEGDLSVLYENRTEQTSAVI